LRRPRVPPLRPYTTLFRSDSHSFVPGVVGDPAPVVQEVSRIAAIWAVEGALLLGIATVLLFAFRPVMASFAEGSRNAIGGALLRSEEHTSELQSRENLVCR